MRHLFRNICASIILGMMALPAQAAEGRAVVWSKQTSPGVWEAGWVILITPKGREFVYVGTEITGNVIEGQTIIVNGKAYIVLANEIEEPE